MDIFGRSIISQLSVTGDITRTSPTHNITSRQSFQSFQSFHDRSKMPSLKPVLPFYDNNPSTPLPDHMELFSGVHHPTTLLADEVLCPAGLDTVTSPVKITTVGTSEWPPHQPRSRHATPAPEFRPPKLPHSTASQTPYPRRVASRRATSVSSERTRDTTADSSSEASSDNESTLSTLSDDSKIPKPQGEPGRPGCGGYTLEATLNWNHKAYAKFKVSFVFVRTAVHLIKTIKLEHRPPPHRRALRHHKMCIFPESCASQGCA